MSAIIVDNVNNLSGAPRVARDIADVIGAPIYCIREESRPSYRATGVGIRSSHLVGYFAGSVALMTNYRFVKAALRSDVVICNTSLTFLFALVARLFGKRVICVVHESKPKNILYRVAFFCTFRVAHMVVTPSRLAYADLNIPMRRWKVIANSLPLAYAENQESVAGESRYIYLLFVDGGRAYKGGELFRQVKHLAQMSGHDHLRFHATSSQEFRDYAGPLSDLGPEIYCKYHFVLVLTDNASWRETFGLVGCEGAACRCVPLFTDTFAYRELWGAFENDLYISRYDPSEVLLRVTRLLIFPERFEELRQSVREHALAVCDRTRFSEAWRTLLANVDA